MCKEEIEKSKNRIKILLKDDCDCPECIKNKGAYKTLLQYIQELEQENNKQSKIIDEMASHIGNWDIDEDICKRVERPLCTDETSVPVSSCIECIKQYFEKKVED